ncbi:hypothetical protein O4G76_11915, partial [Limimaricola sp. G21655-S1]|uniref:hypothetical protein n=1 Tax=Limimaricola sp. G21655-S1 TaxID=3014768 RepID=UPI0022AE8C3E
ELNQAARISLQISAMSKSEKKTKQPHPNVRRAAQPPSEFRDRQCISAPPVRGYLGKGSGGRKRKSQLFCPARKTGMML